MSAAGTAARVQVVPQLQRITDTLRQRGMGATVLVTAISTLFGVVLLAAAGYLGASLTSQPGLEGSRLLAQLVSVLSAMLIGLATYVCGIVTANTFSTVVAGRTRQIALLRLIGASARSQREAVARLGLLVGVLGATVGLVLGLTAAVVLQSVATTRLGREVPYELLTPALLAPPVVVALTTWAAAWAGSRRVLTVTPLQAISAAAEQTREQTVRRPVRNTVAAVLLVVGGALLALGVAAGLVTPLGVVVAFAGGVLSFTGIAVGAALVVPPVLRLVGRLFGGSVPARLAAENALRHPERSSRTAIGVVIGVTLVTMFAVTLESTRQVISRLSDGQVPPEIDTALTTVSTIMTALVAVSAVIAAVGLVNLLSLGIVQRRRELGLLRALGLSTRQIRRMVLLEATHVTVTAVLMGVALGVLYGWAGTQATFGSAHLPGQAAFGQLVAPAIPWTPVVVIVLATAVLTLVASVVPTRLATRVTAVAALADT